LVSWAELQKKHYRAWSQWYYLQKVCSLALCSQTPSQRPVVKTRVSV
jgi:hypothetical protein